ncbi:MAG: hypothetical protein JWR65_1974 [Massilia sp.]|nr:hypothetical protein [Massilia sp.]
MSPERIERLKNYVDLISRRVGGREGLLAGGLLVESPAASGLESVNRDQQRVRSARAALEAMETGHELPVDGFESIEAIIAEKIRPAIDIVDGKFTVTHPLWTHLSTDTAIRTRLEQLIPSIGRIELPGNKRAPYGGTGFVVGTGLVMTNRHVAEIFAVGMGDRRLAFIAGAAAGIDFQREYERPATRVLMVRRVVMIHPYWDMALLEVEGLDQGNPALHLTCRDTRAMEGTQIAVVGYPAFDSRNPTLVQNDLFANRYGVKRLQPGELHGATQAASFGKKVLAATHDCSTLGGNSGSAVLDLQSGEVLGLHFGGLFHEINYCVPADALAADPRVVDAGVRLAGPPPAAVNDVTIWWTRADQSEGAATPVAVAVAPPLAAPAGRTVPAAAATKVAGATEISLQIPLTINLTISAGIVATQVHAIAVQPTMAATEAMREPEHDIDYSSRKGYDEAFLGAGPDYLVRLPGARDARVLAPTLNGGTILRYENFSVAMHARRRLALFTASNVSRDPAMRSPQPGLAITRAALSGLGKNDVEKWFTDPRMDTRFQLPDAFFTKDRKAFDKGHIVRRDDVAWGPSYAELKRANGDTYHVTNCSPQVSQFNQSAKGDNNWGDLENHVFSSAGSEHLSVFAGPVLADNDQIFVGAGDDGKPIRARIPSRFWKVIVAATTSGVAAFGFVLEQDLGEVQWDEMIVPDNLLPLLTTLGEIETMTGVTFGKHLLTSDQFDTPAATELVLRGVARSAEVPD